VTGSHTNVELQGSAISVSSSMRKSIKCFDLCAGIGGFRAGLLASQAVNAVIVGSCEIDQQSIRTYRAMFNTGNEPYVNDLLSVTRFRGEEGLSILRKTNDRSQKIRDQLPRFDLLTAGFPCQPHSLMGNRRGRHDARGTLFYDIAEVIRAMEPKYFILENVRAIKSVNSGRFYADITEKLEKDLGYNLKVWELNALDYGVPQIRRRLFFVGSRDHIPDAPPPNGSVAKGQYESTWHLLERDVDEKYYLSERILKTILKDQHKGYHRKADINRLIARPLTRTMHKMHRASQDNYYSDTFIKGKFDPATKQVILAEIHEDRIRRITPREAFRIQAFPSNYVESAVLSGVSDTQLYMQAGNAVAPPMVTAVVDHLLR
jgi:DNA (cytosine-5)-methyltransferase 1